MLCTEFNINPYNLDSWGKKLKWKIKDDQLHALIYLQFQLFNVEYLNITLQFTQFKLNSAGLQEYDYLNSACLQE